MYFVDVLLRRLSYHALSSREAILLLGLALQSIANLNTTTASSDSIPLTGRTFVVKKSNRCLTLEEFFIGSFVYLCALTVSGQSNCSFRNFRTNWQCGEGRTFLG